MYTETRQRWGVVGKKWLRAFELYAVGKGIDNAMQRKALLLHCAGMEVQDIYYTLLAREPEERETVYTVARDQLSEYFEPRVNVPYERHMFRNTAQQSTETVDQYITRLRLKADHCEFGVNLNEQLRDQVIEKCLSHHLRRKLLEKGRGLTLEQLQTIARAMEVSEKQAINIEGVRVKTEVNKVNAKPTRGRGPRHSSTHSSTQGQSESQPTTTVSVSGVINPDIFRLMKTVPPGTKSVINVRKWDIFQSVINQRKQVTTGRMYVSSMNMHSR